MSVNVIVVQPPPSPGSYRAPCFSAPATFQPIKNIKPIVRTDKKTYVSYRILLRNITASLRPDQLHKSTTILQHANVRNMNTFMNRGP